MKKILPVLSRPTHLIATVVTFQNKYEILYFIEISIIYTALLSFILS